ncbi:DUF3551 domain-containing protein [Tardiphaga sp.]|uniref:DUF3551 domain-containing protein n=1 Tax=Tardiphaga sp. TaxID=1926292 RepID=UPI0026260D08|nr:DUF3551 domain-containing protein [Tardiphaga sp.]MDB5619941.1 hypothetical protein [Tardiphaga sp.]
MSLVRRLAVAAALMFSAAIPSGVAEARSVARPVSGAPPFCVLIGGPRGTSLPQICRFSDYQDCLQAAANLRGNCVANIDYRGELPPTSGSRWPGAAR